MAKESTKIDYDEKLDILTINKTGNYLSSLEIGEFVIDISLDHKVIGMEIANASKNLNVNKEFLATINDVKFNARYGKDWMIIRIKILSKQSEIPAMVSVPVGFRPRN